MSEHGQFHPQPYKPAHPQPPTHKPGVKATPADHAPAFAAATQPAGTAPPQRTFAAHPRSQDMGAAAPATAASTLQGATSADVNRGLGRALDGESSAERRHDGARHRKHEGSGLEGVGANAPGAGDEQRRLARE